MYSNFRIFVKSLFLVSLLAITSCKVIEAYNPGQLFDRSKYDEQKRPIQSQSNMFGDPSQYNSIASMSAMEASGGGIGGMGMDSMGVMGGFPSVPTSNASMYNQQLQQQNIQTKAYDNSYHPGQYNSQYSDNKPYTQSSINHSSYNQANFNYQVPSNSTGSYQQYSGVTNAQNMGNVNKYSPYSVQTSSQGNRNLNSMNGYQQQTIPDNGYHYNQMGNFDQPYNTQDTKGTTYHPIFSASGPDPMSVRDEKVQTYYRRGLNVTSPGSFDSYNNSYNYSGGYDSSYDNSSYTAGSQQQGSQATTIQSDYSGYPVTSKKTTTTYYHPSGQGQNSASNYQQQNSSYQSNNLTNHNLMRGGGNAYYYNPNDPEFK